MRYLVLCGALLVAGCQAVPQNEGTPASVSDVVKKIKRDLGRYQEYNEAALADGPLKNACHGTVGLSIDNVKIQLTTQTDDKTTGTASLTLPVGSGTFSPSLSSSTETKGSQTLTFSLYPQALENSKSGERRAELLKPIDALEYPIAASLQKLREGLLEASGAKPCFNLTPHAGSDGKPAKDDGGTFAFGFTVINDVNGGGTLKFVVFSVGTTRDSQRQTGNMITVTFKAIPGSVDFQ